MDRAQFFIRALHATHLPSGQGPSTFTSKSKKGFFTKGWFLRLHNIDNSETLHPIKIFDTFTMGKI